MTGATASEELIDVIDERDRVVRVATRSEMRHANLLHRVASVLCFDSKGRIYVHRRTATKDVFPGLYDFFASGAVASGETYDVCARRELGEELGIIGPTPEPLFKHRYEGEASRSFTQVYRVIWDGPIVHQATEIAWGGFMSLAEVEKNAQGFQFVPDGLQSFQRYLREHHRS